MGTVVRLQPQPAPKRRVLVVEDNLDSVHSMAMLIRMMGHEVEFAINGFVALEIAREFRPDFILLDIGLPDLKGDKIAQQLKYEPGPEQTRIIAITGLPLQDVQKRALEAGCEQVFANGGKPQNLAILVRLNAYTKAFRPAFVMLKDCSLADFAMRPFFTRPSKPPQ